MKTDRDLRTIIFADLIAKKFGQDRGFKASAASALKIAPSNLASMLSGSLNVADKYINALRERPDYLPPNIVEVFSEKGEILSFGQLDADSIRKLNYILEQNAGCDIEMHDENVQAGIVFLIDREFKKIDPLS